MFGLFLAGEIAFLVSLYVLGADWREKFRHIFVGGNPRVDTAPCFAPKATLKFLEKGETQCYHCAKKQSSEP